MKVKALLRFLAILASVFVCVGLLCVIGTCSDKKQHGQTDIAPGIRALAQPRATQAFKTKQDREDYIQGFAEGYKTVLLNPRATYALGDFSVMPDPFTRGVGDGRQAARAQLKNVGKGITLRDYRYTEVTRKGYVFLAWEQSEFRPIGEKEVWWVYSLADMKPYQDLVSQGGGYDEIKKRRNREYVFATLKGYLSPTGQVGRGYGHMGAYAREFVVTEIVEMKRAE